MQFEAVKRFLHSLVSGPLAKLPVENTQMYLNEPYIHTYILTSAPRYRLTNEITVDKTAGSTHSHSAI